jgi:hypothetical protein
MNILLWVFEVSKTVSHKEFSDDNAKRKFLQQQNKPDEIHENEDENGRESVEITASKDEDEKPTKKQRLHSGLEKGVASSGRLTEVSLLFSENCRLTDPMQEARP